MNTPSNAHKWYALRRSLRRKERENGGLKLDYKRCSSHSWKEYSDGEYLCHRCDHYRIQTDKHVEYLEPDGRCYLRKKVKK